MGNLEKQLDKQDTVIRNYLLDWLDEAATGEIDEKIITEPEFFDNVLLIEQEMLEDFVAGRLSDKENARAEQIYQLPVNQGKLDFARALYKASEQQRRKEKLVETTHPLRWAKLFRGFNWRRLTLVMACCVIIAGVALMTWHLFLSKRAVSERELARLNQEDPSRVNNEKLRELPLPSDSVRTADLMPKISISGTDEIIRFQLSLINNTAESYEATFIDDQGNELFSVSGIKSQNNQGANYVYVLVPANFLHPGDFQINLQGRSSSGTLIKSGNFTFRVTQ